jgi:predicted  nucleic acid-binding Zn-ribbon protein
VDEKKDNGSDEHSNKSVKMSMDQALAELEQLRKSISEKDSLIADLTNQLKDANEYINDERRGKKISEILSRSDFKLEDLVNKTDEELDSTRASLDHAVPPKMNSVRFGVMGADLSDREKGLTVGDLSVVSAQKRKARGGN